MYSNSFSIFLLLFSFFFNDTATTEIYTLSLHDALPIYFLAASTRLGGTGFYPLQQRALVDAKLDHGVEPHRSEEHTSELQSQSNLVCRLLLEKKKKKKKKKTKTKKKQKIYR